MNNIEVKEIEYLFMGFIDSSGNVRVKQLNDRTYSDVVAQLDQSNNPIQFPAKDYKLAMEIATQRLKNDSAHQS